MIYYRIIKKELTEIIERTNYQEKNIDINDMNNIYDFLKELNRPFIMDVWIEIGSMGDKFITRYMKEICKVKYKNLSWKDSVFQQTVKPQPPTIESLEETEPTHWSDEWQGDYTEAEIQYLNNYIDGLKNDFDISTINHMDYAKEIAKTSLLKSKAYKEMLKDPSDDNMKSYKNIVSLFDNLSKSAQFAESQRGANDVGLGSFGQIFDAVEKNNWVPTYVPEDKDMYDKLLDQFANIEKSI